MQFEASLVYPTRTQLKKQKVDKVKILFLDMCTYVNAHMSRKMSRTVQMWQYTSVPPALERLVQEWSSQLASAIKQIFDQPEVYESLYQNNDNSSSSNNKWADFRIHAEPQTKFSNTNIPPKFVQGARNTMVLSLPSHENCKSQHSE